MKKSGKEIKLDDIDRKILKLYNTSTKSTSEIAVEAGFTGTHGWFNSKLCRLRSLGLLRDQKARKPVTDIPVNKGYPTLPTPVVASRPIITKPGHTPFDPILGAVNSGAVDLNKVIEYGNNIPGKKLIIPRIPKIKNVSKMLPRPHKESAVLVLSDLHIGSTTKSRNKDNIHEMFTNLLNNIVSVKSYLLGYDIEKLYIFILGDIITGELIFQGQPYETDMPVVDQWETGVKELGTIIRAMCGLFPKVEVHTMVGNHGRVSFDHNPKTNWERFLYLTLKDHKDLADLKNLKFIVNDDFYEVINIHGWQFMIQHGDKIGGGYSGSPQTGVFKASERWQKAIEGHDVIICGHYHTACNDEFNGTEVFINGTALSDDPFVLTKMKLQSSTSQWFFGVSENYRSTWRYKISTLPNVVFNDQEVQRKQREKFQQMVKKGKI